MLTLERPRTALQALALLANVSAWPGLGAGAESAGHQGQAGYQMRLPPRLPALLKRPGRQLNEIDDMVRVRRFGLSRATKR